MPISEKPTGPFACQYIQGQLEDHNRFEPHAAGNQQHRILSFQLFFPILGAIQKHQYFNDTIRFWSQSNFWPGCDGPTIHTALEQIFCYSKPYDEKSKLHLSKGLIVFSHGFGAWGSFYSFIIEEIVSYGYAVLAINHTYNAGFSFINDVLIQGKMDHGQLFSSKYAEQEHALWVADIKFFLKNLNLVIPKHLIKIISTDKLAIMGQSFGGSIATHFAQYIYPELKCCINLDGAIFGDSFEGVLKTPTLIILGELSRKKLSEKNSCTILADELKIDDEQAKDFIYCYIERIDSLSENQYCQIEIIDGADHVGFTDFVWLKDSRLFQGAPIGSASSDNIQERIRGKTIDFLNKKLTL
jgi:dienelactone hydrolase